MAAVIPEQRQKRAKAVIPTTRRQYSEEQIREAAAHYVVLGHAAKVSAITGISEPTLCAWRKETWWDELVEEVRSDKADEIDAIYTQAIHKAAEAALDRIDNGDVKLLKIKVNGTDELVERRVPISGRDAIMISAIAFDKRQISRNLPTSISSNNSDLLKQLRQQFQSLTGKVIEGEAVEVHSSHNADSVK